MNYPTLHPKLVHLSESQVSELINRYYSGERISHLIEQFGINCSPGNFHTYLPAEISIEPCPNCGSLQETPRLPRKSYKRKLVATLYCSQCNHRNVFNCKCLFCRNKLKTNQRITPQIKPSSTQHFNYPSDQYSIKTGDLTLEQAVSLLALFHCSGYKNINNEMSLYLTKLEAGHFAPTSDYGYELVDRLIAAELLSIYTPSNNILRTLAGFNFNATIKCKLSGDSLGFLLQDIERVTMQEDWPQSWYTQIEELAFDIAFAECMEFFDCCAKERKFPDVDNKSKSIMIRNLLEDFSPGECCRAIHSGAQYASDYLVKNSTSPQSAANYMLTACQRWINKARIENWKLKPFQRNVNCPRSMMSYVYFDTFLKIGEAGFITPVALIDKRSKKINGK